MAGRKPTVSDKEILQAVDVAPGPVAFTSELADELGFSSNQGVTKRLDDLESRGLVAKKSTTNFSVWWITDEGRGCLED